MTCTSTNVTSQVAPMHVAITSAVNIYIDAFIDRILACKDTHTKESLRIIWDSVSGLGDQLDTHTENAHGDIISTTSSKSEVVSDTVSSASTGPSSMQNSTSDIVHTTCQYMFKKGKNKDKLCGKNTLANFTTCSKHKKHGVELKAVQNPQASSQEKVSDKTESLTSETTKDDESGGVTECTSKSDKKVPSDNCPVKESGQLITSTKTKVKITEFPFPDKNETYLHKTVEGIQNVPNCQCGCGSPDLMCIETIARERCQKCTWHKPKNPEAHTFLHVRCRKALCIDKTGEHPVYRDECRLTQYYEKIGCYWNPISRFTFVSKTDCRVSGRYVEGYVQNLREEWLQECCIRYGYIIYEPDLPRDVLKAYQEMKHTIPDHFRNLEKALYGEEASPSIKQCGDAPSSENKNDEKTKVTFTKHVTIHEASPQNDDDVCEYTSVKNALATSFSSNSDIVTIESVLKKLKMSSSVDDKDDGDGNALLDDADDAVQENDDDDEHEITDAQRPPVDDIDDNEMELNLVKGDDDNDSSDFPEDSDISDLAEHFSDVSDEDGSE